MKVARKEDTSLTKNFQRNFAFAASEARIKKDIGLTRNFMFAAKLAKTKVRDMSTDHAQTVHRHIIANHAGK